MRKLLLLVTFVIFLVIPAQVYARKIDPKGIKLPDGYSVEAVVANLTVPTTAIFDGSNLIIAESGEANTGKPRILRISPEGKVSVLASEGLEPPVTGLLMASGNLYVSHRTKVSIIKDGKLIDIITGLPSNGDHQNNKIVLGPDGKIYIGQGTVTNSGVVGVDNYLFGWLTKYPKIHDVPCKDIILTGQNFESDNPLASGKNSTGAYEAFGTQSQEGEVIKGNIKCNGSILRFNSDGSDLEVYAWGFRNPFGVAFDQSGKLWTNFHGADVRGSRPIFNDPDYLVKVEKGGWYGWPEFFNGKPANDDSLKSPDGPQPEFLWKEHPNLSLPFTTYDPHSAANGLAFSPGGSFGFNGDGFSALFGTFTTPTAGVNVIPSGFKVVRISINTGQVSDFASNKIPGPSYINQGGGFNRPSDVLFGPDSSLYVVDFGSTTLTKKGLELVPQTGVIWRIYNDGQKQLAVKGPIMVSANYNISKNPLVSLNQYFISSQIPHLLFLLIPIGVIIGFIYFMFRKIY